MASTVNTTTHKHAFSCNQQTIPASIYGRYLHILQRGRHLIGAQWAHNWRHELSHLFIFRLRFASLVYPHTMRLKYNQFTTISKTPHVVLKPLPRKTPWNASEHRNKTIVTIHKILRWDSSWFSNVLTSQALPTSASRVLVVDYESLEILTCDLGQVRKHQSTRYRRILANSWSALK